MTRGIICTIVLFEFVVGVLSRICTYDVVANTGIPIAKLNQKSSILSQVTSGSLEACYKECCNLKDACSTVSFDSASQQSNNTNCILFSFTSGEYPTVTDTNKTLVKVARLASNGSTSGSSTTTVMSVTDKNPTSETISTNQVNTLVTTPTFNHGKTDGVTATTVTYSHATVNPFPSQTTVESPNGKGTGNTTSKQRFINFDEEHLAQTTEYKEGWVGQYSENNITDRNGSMSASKMVLTSPATVATTTLTTKSHRVTPNTSVESSAHSGSNLTTGLNTTTEKPTDNTTAINGLGVMKNGTSVTDGLIHSNESTTATSTSTSPNHNITTTPNNDTQTGSVNYTTTANPLKFKNMTKFNTTQDYLNYLKQLLKEQGLEDDTNKTEEVKNGSVGQYNQSNLIDKSANVSITRVNISAPSTYGTKQPVSVSTVQTTAQSTVKPSTTTTTGNLTHSNTTIVTQSPGSNTSRTPSVTNVTSTTPRIESTVTASTGNSTENATGSVPTSAKSANKTLLANGVNKPDTTRDDSISSLQQSTISAALVAAMSFGILFFVAIAALFTKKLFESWKHRHYSRVDYLVNGMYG